MNEQRDPRLPRDPEIEAMRNLERELNELPSPEADAAFRHRMREAFIAGRTAIATDPAGDMRRARPSRASLRLAATASVLVLLGLGWFATRGPGVTLLDASGEGVVMIDGVAIAVGDRAALGAALAPGATVEVPEGVTLVTAIPETALLEAAAGSVVVLPRAYGRWWPSRARCELRHGEVRFASGPKFAGRELEFATPHGLVRITGTIVSVQSDENGTCVCVIEGTALVGRDATALEPIPAGRRMVLPAGGGASTSPVVPVHAHGVEAMLERVGDRFPR